MREYKQKQYFIREKKEVETYINEGKIEFYKRRNFHFYFEMPKKEKNPEERVKEEESVQ